MITKQLNQETTLAISQEASKMLKLGNVIIYPTDTLYALGADALNESAVERFFSLKKRPDNKPVPLFVRDIVMAKELAFIDKRQEAIMQKLWPGPYTLVVFKRNKVSLRLTGDTQKIGLRIPDNTFCTHLLREFDGPITASSANISGQEATVDPQKIISQFEQYSITPDYFVDSGTLNNTQPSTVIDITSNKPKFLRMNPANLRQMQNILSADL